MSDFHKCLDYATKSNPLWKKYLETLSKFIEINFTENIKAQKGEHYDALVVFEGKGNTYRVDFKTRMQYHDRFLNDELICVEIMGNVELNRLGSSWYNSNSDLILYGFNVKGELKDPFIFKTQECVQHIKQHEEKYWVIYGKTYENGKFIYKTKCVMVPLKELLPFILKI